LANVLEPQEVARLRELRAQGASIGEIARLTGHSKATVHRYVAGQGRSAGGTATTRRDLAARVERLEEVLLELLPLLTAGCGYCGDGRLGLVIRCSKCRREWYWRWEVTPKQFESMQAVLEGKGMLVWPEPRESHVNKAGR
jgi:hypothetical protein